MTPLYVDYREGSKELLEPLVKLDLPAEIADLDSGDLAWVGRGESNTAATVCVEYKKLSECVGSMRSDRLKGHQAPLMHELYQFNYLLIETKGQLTWGADGLLMERSGRMTFDPIPGHMKISEFNSRLNELHIVFGLVPHITHSRRETLKWIEAQYRSWTDHSVDEHRERVAIYKPAPVAPVSDFVYIMAGFKGVSYELAKRLERRFGTLDAFLSSPMEAWMDTDGIGPEKARMMMKQLTGAAV